MVADLPPAELAQPQERVATLLRANPKRKRGGLFKVNPVARPPGSPGNGRHPVPPPHLRLDQVGHLVEHRVGQVRERRGRLPDVGLAEQVGDGDPQQLLVLEAVQDRVRVARPAAQLGQLRPQLVGRPRLVEHQAVEQLVDHPRVVDQEPRQERAAGAQLDVELEARRVGAEQLPEHGLGPQRRGHPLQVRQRPVGVGGVGDRPQQLRRDARQEVPAPAGRQERHRLAGQLREVLVRLGHVAERVAAEDGPDGGLVRVGVEDQVGLRLGPAAGVGERLVEQVVEDGPVEGGLVVQVLEEPVERVDQQVAGVQGRRAGLVQRRPFLRGQNSGFGIRGKRVPGGVGVARRRARGRGRFLNPDSRILTPVQVPHPQRQLPLLVGRRGQPVRLQVEQQLQPVLGLAEEPVRVGQDVRLVRGEAPGDLQRLQGQECVPLADRRQVAAVEQLQELHGVLDVADAAAAGLHVDRVGGRSLAVAARLGPLLHLPLQRLDLVDLGEAEVLAVDERLDGSEELAG